MNTDTADTITEAIEVFINSVLYIRKVYPGTIFEKRKVYNSLIYVSIYPPLNDYILNVLVSMKTFIETNELSRIEIIIYKNEFTVYETYIFEINSKHYELYKGYCSRDKYLIDFEEQLRESLLTLEDRVKILGELPEDAKFKINIHTTQTAFVKFSHNSKYQNFSWLQQTKDNLIDKTKISILPITEIDSVGLQFYAEKY